MSGRLVKSEPGEEKRYRFRAAAIWVRTSNPLYLARVRVRPLVRTTYASTPRSTIPDWRAIDLLFACVKYSGFWPFLLPNHYQ